MGEAHVHRRINKGLTKGLPRSDDMNYVWNKLKFNWYN